ncbi:MAG: glycosyltransferase [Gemmiger sp.]|nr:glycosyltransferase [Gemmiger sp.]
MFSPLRRVGAVVVTYNRKALLARCLACLQNQQGNTMPLCEIWVVDNASTDGTEAMVKALAIPGLIYRNTGENLGGAGGFWYGIKAAVEAGCDALWLMDDDTLPTPGALQALLGADAALGGSYGWLSSRALTPAGADQPMNRQRKTPYRDIAGYDATDAKGNIPAVMASFVSLFLRAETVRKYGLPYREFFIWSDDWEYTRRISKTEPCWVVPGSRVTHAMQQSTVVNIAADTPARLPRYRYFYRNDVVLYRGEGALGWLWLLLKYAWHSAQVLAGHTPDKLARLGVIWHGFAEGVRFAPAQSFPQKMEAPHD